MAIGDRSTGYAAQPRASLQDNSRDGPVTRLSLIEKAAYGSGEIGANLPWLMVGGFLLLFYSDVARLPVAALGTLMLVTRILDAVFDPLVGFLVDRTRTRYGKARPYLLYGAVPFAVMLVLTYSIPPGSDGFRLAYAYVTFTVLGFLFSLVYIPYGSMLPMLTRDPAEKAQVASFRAMGTSVSSILAYGITLPVVGLFATRQTGFVAAAALFGVISVAIMWFVFSQTRERYVDPPAEVPRPIRRTLGDMLRNPMWWVASSFAFILFVKLSLLVSSFVYYAKTGLGSEAIVTIILPMMSVAILVGGAVSGPVLARFGVVVSNVASLGLGALFIGLSGMFSDQFPIFLTLFLVGSFFSGVQGTTAFILNADAVEVHERRFGYRAEGILYSSVSFGMKLGLAAGTAATAYVLGWIGYNPDSVTESASASIAILFYGGTIALLIVQAIGILFYNRAFRP